MPSARLVGEDCRVGVAIVDAMGYLYLTARSGNTYADLASIVARCLVDYEWPVEKLFTSFTRGSEGARKTC